MEKDYLQLEKKMDNNYKEISKNRTEWSDKMAEFIRNESELENELNIRNKDLEKYKDIEQ